MHRRSNAIKADYRIFQVKGSLADRTLERYLVITEGVKLSGKHTEIRH